MTPRTVRSVGSTTAIWAGAGLVVLGMFTAPFGLVELRDSALLAAVLWMAAGAVIAAIGAVVILIGVRRRTRVDAGGVSWTTALGGTTTVPWPQIARVLVPGRGDPGQYVTLQLHDGRCVEIPILRKVQAADGNTALSPWYLRAGAGIQEAHRQWWESTRR